MHAAGTGAARASAWAVAARPGQPWLRRTAALSHARAPLVRRLNAFAVHGVPPERPPFAVRVALVGTATGLFTPAFATAGVAVAWHRLLPHSLVGQGVRNLTTALIGGGAFTLCYHYVAPFLRSHGELVAPFAAANAVASAAWYAVLESTLGLEAMAGTVSVGAFVGTQALRTPLPVAGLGVGLATAITAPTLWPMMIRALWPEPFVHAVFGPDGSPTALIDVYANAFLPVALPVCLAAGGTMHILLSPLVLGVRGVPWTGAALPALCALVGVSAVYMGACRTPLASFYWEARISHVDGTEYSRNILTGEVQQGTAAAERSRSARALLLVWRSARAAWRWALGREPHPDDVAATVFFAGEGGGDLGAWLSPAEPADPSAAEMAALARLLSALGCDARATTTATPAAPPLPPLEVIDYAHAPLNRLIDICVAAELARAHALAAGAASLDDESRLALLRERARREHGIAQLDTVVELVVCAAALGHGGGGAGGREDGGAPPGAPAPGGAPPPPPPPSGAAHRLKASMREQAVSVGLAGAGAASGWGRGAAAADGRAPHARRWDRLLVRALFARAADVDVALAAYGVRPRDPRAAEARAEAALREESRRRAVARLAQLAGALAQTALALGVGAALLRWGAGGSTGS